MLSHELRNPLGALVGTSGVRNSFETTVALRRPGRSARVLDRWDRDFFGIVHLGA